MRRTVRRDPAPEVRLGRAIAALPPSARSALAVVADRDDLPLVAGSWEQDAGGCLVANVVRSLAVDPLQASAEQTLDLRVLALLPELSSRDLNRLVVAWDEAAAAQGRADDPALRRLLRGGLAVAVDLLGDEDGNRDDPRRPGSGAGGGREPRRRPVGSAVAAEVGVAQSS